MASCGGSFLVATATATAAKIVGVVATITPDPACESESGWWCVAVWEVRECVGGEGGEGGEGVCVCVRARARGGRDEVNA